jgi:hypothetical protein
MNAHLQGGCACGAVRYQLQEEPWDAGICHCRLCQLVSGAPAMAFASVAPSSFSIVRGQDRVRRFRSTSFGWRQFCGDCGTPLTIQVDFQPETIDFTIATLDDPGALPPGFHIFRSSRIAWFETADHLPRHERFREETRGLEGSEPPA